MFLLALVLMQIPARLPDPKADAGRQAAIAKAKVQSKPPVENNVQDLTKDEKIDLLQLQLQIDEDELRQLDFASKAETQKDASKDGVAAYNEYVQKLVAQYHLGKDAQLTRSLQFISPPKDLTPPKK